jgi:drug/metabolite transporter (DMT)-like permease
MTFIQNKKLLPIAAFVLLSLIWSSTWMVLKLGLWSLPPFLAAGIRFLAAFIFLSLYALIQKLNFPWEIKTHLFYVGFGLVNFTGGYAFVYWGQQYIGSGLASVLFSVMPFFVLFLSIWLLPEEKITFKKFFGVSIGFMGVITIFWDQVNFSDQHPLAVYGMIAVLAGPLFATFGTITAKRVGKSIHPIVLVTYPMLYASISFFVLSILFERTRQPVFDFNAIFSIIYLALIGTAIAFVVYFWMLKNTSAVLMSMITFVTPPLALFWGWLLMGEHISIFLIIGMILIFIGITVIRK